MVGEGALAREDVNWQTGLAQRTAATSKLLTNPTVTRPRHMRTSPELAAATHTSAKPPSCQQEKTTLWPPPQPPTPMGPPPPQLTSAAQ